MKVTYGISFAIPIDYVRAFLEQSKITVFLYFSIESICVSHECSFHFLLMSGKRLREKKSYKPEPARRYMGITMLTLTDDILSELRQRSHTIPADVKSGVLIWKVIVGSPAYK